MEANKLIQIQDGLRTLRAEAEAIRAAVPYSGDPATRDALSEAMSVYNLRVSQLDARIGEALRKERSA